MKKFDGQNRNVLLIVGNCSPNLEIGGLKLCFLQRMLQPSRWIREIFDNQKPSTSSRMIQQIIKAIDANQSIPKMNILDATKMFNVC